MFRKKAIAAGVALGIVVSGLNFAQVPAVLASTLAGSPPHIALVVDGSTAFEKLSRHEYPDNRPFDRDLDRIGTDITTTFEHAAGSQLPAAAELGLRIRLAKANASLVVPLNVLQEDGEVLSISKELQGKGKFVYVYGSNVTPETVEALLGSGVSGKKATPDPEDVQKRAQDRAFQQTYSVIGVASSSKGTQVRIGMTDSHNPETIREDALRWVVTWELNRTNHVKEQASLTDTAQAAEIRVASDYNLGTTWYNLGEVVAGRILLDYDLHKKTDETVEDYDYFGAKVRYEIEDGAAITGSPNHIIDVPEIKHVVPWSIDEIESWGPEDTSGSTTFAVQLPELPLEWTFETGSGQYVDASGSLQDDWASWTWGTTFPYTMDEPFQPYAGTEWSSTGSLAGLDLYHTVQFSNGLGGHFSRSWNYNLRYDY